jgi:stage V sporulation protein SpoVS
MLLGNDVVGAVVAMKRESGNDLQIIGSGNLIQSLQAASLIDEYNVCAGWLIRFRPTQFEGDRATVEDASRSAVATDRKTTWFGGRSECRLAERAGFEPAGGY